MGAVANNTRRGREAGEGGGGGGGRVTEKRVDPARKCKKLNSGGRK